MVSACPPAPPPLSALVTADVCHWSERGTGHIRAHGTTVVRMERQLEALARPSQCSAVVEHSVRQLALGPDPDGCQPAWPGGGSPAWRDGVVQCPRDGGVLQRSSGSG